MSGPYRGQASFSPTTGTRPELPPHMKYGNVAVFPFPYDSEGQQKVELYFSRRNAPLYVLGSNSRLTAATYLKSDQAQCERIVELLGMELAAETK